MGIEVAVEYIVTEGRQFTCVPYGEAQVTFGPYLNYDEAALVSAHHQLTCESCEEYPAYISAVLDVEEGIHMSNANAAMIFGIIGLDPDADEMGYVGSMQADDFLGHVMIALAQERLDTAVSAVTTKTPGSATHIECGLPEGYVTVTLTRLCDVALEAQRLGRSVTWG